MHDSIITIAATYKGTWYPHPKCLLSLFIFLGTQLIALDPATAAENTVVIADTQQVYSIHAASLKKNTLKRYLEQFSSGNIKNTLLHFLDSSGYFHPLIDTSRTDTTIIDAGPCAYIDTIIIHSGYPCAIDSLQRIVFPMRYNSGALSQTAKQALRFFAIRGYPFATLSMRIDTPATSDSLSDTTRHTQPQTHYTVELTIDSDARCVFDAPYFRGTYILKDKFLLKDILFTKGTLFDINKVETSCQRLLSRNYISSAEASAPSIIQKPALPDSTSEEPRNEAQPSGNNTETVDTVAVVFTVADKSGMGIDGAIGYNSDAASRWSGLLTISLLNILRRAEALSLYYRGEEHLQIFELELSAPYPFMLPVFFSGSFGLEIQDKSYGYLHGQCQVLTQLKELWQAGIAVQGHETTTGETAATTSSWHYIGADLILQRLGEQYRMGVNSNEFVLRSGTGFVDRKEGKFSRWNVNVSAGSHLPLFKRFALLTRLTTSAVTFDKKDSLHITEKIRVGGHNSLRGYTENQFPFIAVAYVQTEYLYYFNPLGSVYIFMDGGVGFANKLSITRSDRTSLFGYGLGIRMPIKVGSISLEWARNYNESRGLGRIHLRIRNNLSAGM